MAFVIYNIETTIIYGEPNYATEAGAKRALTRLAKAGKLNKAHYDVEEYGRFIEHVERKHIRYGVGPAAGKEYTVRVNEPWGTGPWSESYWSA